MARQRIEEHLRVKQVGITLPPEMDELIDFYCSKLHCSQSALVLMALDVAIPAFDHILKTLFDASDVAKSVVEEYTVKKINPTDKEKFLGDLQKIVDRIDKRNSITINAVKDAQERAEKRAEITKAMTPQEMGDHIRSQAGDVLKAPTPAVLIETPVEPPIPPVATPAPKKPEIANKGVVDLSPIIDDMDDILNNLS